MKFPLQERPFGAVRLSPTRCADLEQLAADVVDATLDEYYDFVNTQQRVLSSAQWKPIKKRDNVTVFKELIPRHRRVFGPAGIRESYTSPTSFLLPKMLAVGTVKGTMTDMMLGTALRDAASLLIKASYVNDAFVDCDVLHEMRGATADDPFRIVSLKWNVKIHPSGLNALISPRDLILVQSSGIIHQQGIGYHIVHSVDIPECPSLDARFGIMRARISTAFLFRQIDKDVVEIYVANYVDPNGSTPESVAVLSSANSLCGAWKAINCAQKMKLSWVLTHRNLYLGAGYVRASLVRASGCEICSHKTTLLSGGLSDCVICAASVCSRCRVTVKLSKANMRLEVTMSKHDFCKTCFLRITNDDALRIAQEMYTGAPIVEWNHVAAAAAAERDRVHSNDSSEQRRFGDWRDTMSTLSSGIYSDLVDGKQSHEESLYEDEEGEEVYALESFVMDPFIVDGSEFGSDSLMSRPSEAVEGTSSVPKMEDPDWQLMSQIQSLQLTANATLDLAKDVTSKMTKP